MNILFLYSEVMPYNIPVFKSLVSKGYEVHVIRWDMKKLSPYEPSGEIDGVTFYKRSNFKGLQTLYKKIESISPLIIYTSGWMDKLYCIAAWKYRKHHHIPVIAGSDTQWKGGKQWINVLLSPFCHKRWFTHILIGGIWQYEYARRLGFSKNEILMHVYSADVSTFLQVDIQSKKLNYPKNLLFIGRFAKEKGLNYLLEAWNSITDHKEWILTLVNGGGDLSFKPSINVVVKNFLSQDKLVDEMQNAGAFILPSVFEPWALVLHEASAAGLPILSSDQCGAVPYFVLHKYNGYIFESKSVEAIRKSLLNLFNMSGKELIQMSNRSRSLSYRIDPDIVASSILSVI